MKYLKKFKNSDVPKIPDFDVLSVDPKRTAQILKERLEESGLKNVTTNAKKGVGELVPFHVEVKIGKETIVFIYKPMACHNYNIVSLGNFDIRIATIDTMLSFYLAFLFINRPYYDPHRILCMSKYLFDIQRENIRKNTGILKRFSVECYGTQPTMPSIRSEKNDWYNLLKKEKGSRKWEEHFLMYRPTGKRNKSKRRKHKRRGTRKKGRRRIRRK